MQDSGTPNTPNPPPGDKEGRIARMVQQPTFPLETEVSERCVIMQSPTGGTTEGTANCPESTGADP